jgi:hypothetical protein
MPVPTFGVELCRDRLTHTWFTRCVQHAHLCTPAEAVAAGFLDELVAPADVRDGAIERARPPCRIAPPRTVPPHPQHHAGSDRRGTARLARRRHGAVRGDRMTSDVAGATPAAPVDAVEFYWRPGCMFCKHLEWRLRRRRCRCGTTTSGRPRCCGDRPLDRFGKRDRPDGRRRHGTLRQAHRRARCSTLRRQAPQLDVAADADLDE